MDIIYSGSTLSIKPNYIYVKPNFENINKKQLLPKNQNSLINLLDNKNKGNISRKTDKKIRGAVNWLFSSAKWKWNKCDKTKKYFKWKINFVTLTIPELENIVTDKFAKEVLLWEWIDSMRSTEGLKNYIWKSETQDNGFPHFHITTDTYLDKNKLNASWNKILEKYNLLDSYKSIHNNTNAPSTRVNAVKNIKNLQAYICDYLAKEDNFKSFCSLSVELNEKKRYKDNWLWSEGNYYKVILNSKNEIVSHKINSDRELVKVEFDMKNDYKEKWRFVECKCGVYWERKRNIQGRIWGSNYSLSRANKLKSEVYINNGDEIDRFFNSSAVKKQKVIVGKDEYSEGKDLGDLIFMNADSWEKAPFNLREIYHNERMKIQSNQSQKNLLCKDDNSEYSQYLGRSKYEKNVL